MPLSRQKRSFFLSLPDIRKDIEDIKPTMTQYKAVRALYDEDSITVYQAYNTSIATAAVLAQKLDAWPTYLSRMTWIKPSFCWMMYRCGYTYKDSNQERVLALRIKRTHFESMLRSACLAHKPHKRGESVVVQWDPERGPRLERLEYRSLQVGIPAGRQREWIDGIEGIEDVTDVARKLKERLGQDKSVGVDELVEEGLLPRERVYEVPEDIREILEMG